MSSKDKECSDWRKGMAKGPWPPSFAADMHTRLPFEAAWPGAAARPGSGVPAAGAFAGYPTAAAFVQQGGRDLVVEVVPAGGSKRPAAAAAVAASSDDEGGAPRQRPRGSVRRMLRKPTLQVPQQQGQEQEPAAAADGHASPQGIDALLHAAELFSKLEEQEEEEQEQEEEEEEEQ